MRNHRRNLGLDMLIGAASGAAATWLMDQVTTAIMERQPEEVSEREKAARGDKSALENAAEKGAALAGKEITKEERKKIGLGIHWSLGVTSGAVYGALRNRIPAMGIGSGLTYGAAYFLLMDEAALTALGLAPPPQNFPWQTHARGLVGHLVLGGALESVFDALDLVADAAG